MNIIKKHIPVTIISGVASCGKSALINLLQSTMGNVCMGVIHLFDDAVFGNTANKPPVIQHTFTRNVNYTALRGEMQKLAENNIDYLVIENSGNRDPLSLLYTLEGDETPTGKTTYGLDTLVTVLDACSFINDYSGMGDEKESQVKDMLNRQVNCANVIVLNKKDLVSTSHLNIIKAFVRVSNEDAVILESFFWKNTFHQRYQYWLV